MNRVHRYRAYDPQWAIDVDQALMDGRDPNVPHGTANGYRWHKCRCPECRTAKNGGT